MIRIKYAVLALASAMLALHGAPSAAEAGNNHETARQIVAERLGADYTQKQIATFNIIAHSVAASTLCDRIDLDEAAVKKLLEGVIAENTPAAADQTAREALRDRTLVGFGALVGLMLEDAAPNNAKFCGAAESDMKRQGSTSLLKPHVAS